MKKLIFEGEMLYVSKQIILNLNCLLDNDQIDICFEMI